MPPDALRSALLAWYDAQARDLPWRVSPPARAAGVRPDPYRVWLSEVMLQQTTVPHASRYFTEFTRRWPTVADLAAADDGEVMSAWAGLGYYARARNLLACARAVAGAADGAFPGREADLRGLPGLGPYTAAAVAAIAFGQPANVVDGNVERVMARLFAVQTPLPAAKAELRDLAATFVTDERPGDWAQALMDLGATVCRPRAPLCESCPIAAWCRATAWGEAESYPRKTPRAARPHRQGVAFVLVADKGVGLVRRPPKGLLGGMLGLPTTPWRIEPWGASEALRYAPADGDWRDVGAVDHVFTHFSLELTVMALSGGARAPADLLWKSPADAERGLPTVFRKALARALA